jgi:hypothetical protein
MSHKGYFLPIEGVGGVSALPPIPTELLHHSERRKGPTSDISQCSKIASFLAIGIIVSDSHRPADSGVLCSQ